MNFAQLSAYVQRAVIMTSLILGFLVHGNGGSGLPNELPSEINCDDLQGLCVGKTYHTVCSIPENYLFQQVMIKGGNCYSTNDKDLNFDYATQTETINETKTYGKCGEIKGVSLKHECKNTIRLTLSSVSKYIDGALVTCFGQSTENEPVLSKTCNINLAGVPLQPTNLSISNSECSPPLLVTWEQPSSGSSKADEHLSFLVTVNSSLGYNETNTSNSFIVLDKIVAEDIMNLTVCISTRNCFGLSPPVCKKILIGVPLQPTNLSISNSECSSPLLVTWEQPSSSSKADEHLSFLVTVNSSLGYNETNTSDSFIFLDKIVAEDIMNLTVCVSTRNCFGLSSPVCRKILIVPEKAPLPPPLINVTILNSTAVQLSIELNSTASGVNTCFDIERNFRITRRCISETEIVLDMQRESHKGIHTIRARASQHSHGKVVPGQWSKPACVTFAPPLPLLFLNHTIVKSGQHSNVTLKLSIELQDSSNFVGICHIPQVQEIEISIKGAVQNHYNISRNVMKQEMSFKLKNTSEQVVKISATPLSIVGPGPEQVTYVYISSGTCLNAYCLNVFIGTLLVSLFVIFQ